MRSSLEKSGFIFDENDISFEVHYTDKGIKKAQSWSLFWSRKILEQYKPTYSMIIKGEVKKDEKGSIIDAELIEYHHNREHFFSGTIAVEEYFDNFCKIFTRDYNIS